MKEQIDGMLVELRWAINPTSKHDIGNESGFRYSNLRHTAQSCIMLRRISDRPALRFCQCASCPTTPWYALLTIVVPTTRVCSYMLQRFHALSLDFHRSIWPSGSLLLRQLVSICTFSRICRIFQVGSHRCCRKGQLLIEHKKELSAQRQRLPPKKMISVMFILHLGHNKQPVHRTLAFVHQQHYIQRPWRLHHRHLSRPKPIVPKSVLCPLICPVLLPAVAMEPRWLQCSKMLLVR